MNIFFVILSNTFVPLLLELFDYNYIYKLFKRKQVKNLGNFNLMK